jgi:hypothetical protein
MPANDVEKRRPLPRRPNDPNFGSLLMLAVTAGAFLLVTWVAPKGLFFFLQESPIRETPVAALRTCSIAAQSNALTYFVYAGGAGSGGMFQMSIWIFQALPSRT